MLKLSKPTSPQKLFLSDCIALYPIWLENSREPSNSKSIELVSEDDQVDDDLVEEGVGAGRGWFPPIYTADYTVFTAIICQGQSQT